VEFDGHACPSQLKMDVSLPDEPFWENDTFERFISFFLFWVKGPSWPQG
jgi:hypothetical protein